MCNAPEVVVLNLASIGYTTLKVFPSWEESATEIRKLIVADVIPALNNLNESVDRRRLRREVVLVYH